MFSGTRIQLYANDLTQGIDAGNALGEINRGSGLPFSEGGGISLDDPLVHAMEAIFDSPKGSWQQTTEN
jgi:hypothetical protein